ncbi:MAG: haloacid dehalogenase type II [Pseudohongiellaceae bacterium]
MSRSKIDFGTTVVMSRRRLLSMGGSLTLLLPGMFGKSLLAQSAAAETGRSPALQALIFDVFGTVVDWRSSIIREGQLLSARKGYQVDWAQFADRWRNGYGPAMNQVRSGELPWTTIDSLHRKILDELVTEFGLEGMSEPELDHFNRAWHRLMPWPDSVPGLNRLKTRYTIAPLSNGNVALLLNMGKNAGLPWDTILSAELSRHYKPDPEAYLKASELLDLPPAQIMMVAAHPGDLRAAAALGFKTAYVYRPLERGAEQIVQRNTTDPYDIRAADFVDLAEQLGA